MRGDQVPTKCRSKSIGSSATLVGEDPISEQTCVNCLLIRDSIPRMHNHSQARLSSTPQHQVSVRHPVRTSAPTHPPTPQKNQEHYPRSNTAAVPMLKAPWEFNNSVLLWVDPWGPWGSSKMNRTRSICAVINDG